MFSGKLLLRLPLARGNVISSSPTSFFHTSSQLNKEKAGKYKVTLNRTKPLTYEMAFKPQEIGRKKDFNSYNTSQLEDTFLMKEEIGQDLPHKMFIEDIFIRKFMAGTWPEAILSEIIIKRQHNLIRIAFLTDRYIQVSKVYFLIGYTEEMLSYWLKCPVKLEIQTVESKDDLIFKYI